MLDGVETEAMEVLTGVIASDGGVYQQKHAAIKSPFFKVTQSGILHHDWLLVVRGALATLGVDVPSIYPRAYNGVNSSGNPYVYTVLQSRTHPLMVSLRDLWYPKGVKEIPLSFRLSPISLAHMTMGDGSSSWHQGGNIVACLSTQNFSERSIELVEDALRGIGIDHTGRGHVKLKNKKSGSGIVITLLQDSVDDFMAMIEPHVVPSFRYKVKYRGTKC